MNQFVAGPRALRDPRSREYAIQTMHSLKRFLDSTTFDSKHGAEELQLIQEHRHWEVCGFADVDAYVRAEVGITFEKLKQTLSLLINARIPPEAPYGSVDALLKAEIGETRESAVSSVDDATPA